MFDLSQIVAVVFAAIIIVYALVTRIYKWRQEAADRSDYETMQVFARNLSKMSYARIKAKTGRGPTEAKDMKATFIKATKNMPPPPESSWR